MAKAIVTPEWKRLIERCRRLWETYDKAPTKKRLEAFGAHIEKMKDSKSAKVKAERARAARKFRSEWKRQGYKSPVAKRKVAKKKVAKKKTSRRRKNPVGSNLGHPLFPDPKSPSTSDPSAAATLSVVPVNRPEVYTEAWANRAWGAGEKFEVVGAQNARWGLTRKVLTDGDPADEYRGAIVDKHKIDKLFKLLAPQNKGLAVKTGGFDDGNKYVALLFSIEPDVHTLLEERRKRFEASDNPKPRKNAKKKVAKKKAKKKTTRRRKNPPDGLTLSDITIGDRISVIFRAQNMKPIWYDATISDIDQAVIKMDFDDSRLGEDVYEWYQPEPEPAYWRRFPSDEFGAWAEIKRASSANPKPSKNAKKTARRRKNPSGWEHRPHTGEADIEYYFKGEWVVIIEGDASRGTRSLPTAGPFGSGSVSLYRQPFRPRTSVAVDKTYVSTTGSGARSDLGLDWAERVIAREGNPKPRKNARKKAPAKKKTTRRKKNPKYLTIAEKRELEESARDAYGIATRNLDQYDTVTGGLLEGYVALNKVLSRRFGGMVGYPELTGYEFGDDFYPDWVDDYYDYTKYGEMAYEVLVKENQPARIYRFFMGKVTPFRQAAESRMEKHDAFASARVTNPKPRRKNVKKVAEKKAKKRTSAKRKTTRRKANPGLTEVLSSTSDPAKYLQSYRVTGSGRFPVDMLRYDESWVDSGDNLGPEHRSIKVFRHVPVKTDRYYPTADRWASQGWEVSDVEYEKLDIPLKYREHFRISGPVAWGDWGMAQLKSWPVSSRDIEKMAGGGAAFVRYIAKKTDTLQQSDMPSDFEGDQLELTPYYEYNPKPTSPRKKAKRKSTRRKKNPTRRPERFTAEGWNGLAAELLVGRTISDARWMTDEEAKDGRWGYRTLLIFLDNGAIIYALSDDAFNHVGTLYGIGFGGDDVLFPQMDIGWETSEGKSRIERIHERFSRGSDENPKPRKNAKRKRGAKLVRNMRGMSFLGDLSKQTDDQIMKHLKMLRRARGSRRDRSGHEGELKELEREADRRGIGYGRPPFTLQFVPDTPREDRILGTVDPTATFVTADFVAPDFGDDIEAAIEWQDSMNKAWREQVGNPKDNPCIGFHLHSDDFEPLMKAAQKTAPKPRTKRKVTRRKAKRNPTTIDYPEGWKPSDSYRWALRVSRASVEAQLAEVMAALEVPSRDTLYRLNLRGHQRVLEDALKKNPKPRKNAKKNASRLEELASSARYRELTKAQRMAMWSVSQTAETTDPSQFIPYGLNSRTMKALVDHGLMEEKGGSPGFHRPTERGLLVAIWAAKFEGEKMPWDVGALGGMPNPRKNAKRKKAKRKTTRRKTAKRNPSVFVDTRKWAERASIPELKIELAELKVKQADPELPFLQMTQGLGLIDIVEREIRGRDAGTRKQKGLPPHPSRREPKAISGSFIANPMEKGRGKTLFKAYCKKRQAFKKALADDATSGVVEKKAEIAGSALDNLIAFIQDTGEPVGQSVVSVNELCRSRARIAKLSKDAGMTKKDVKAMLKEVGETMSAGEDEVEAVADMLLNPGGRRRKNASGRLSTAAKRKINADLIAAGFDGNGRFKTMTAALSALKGVLSKHGIEEDEVFSADRFRYPSGQESFLIAFSNREEPMSPQSIDNASISWQWHRHKDTTDLYEIVSYVG